VSLAYLGDAVWEVSTCSPATLWGWQCHHESSDYQAG
jgi:23S rRNA maturation mini-RNase III